MAATPVAEVILVAAPAAATPVVAVFGVGGAVIMVGGAVFGAEGVVIVVCMIPCSNIVIDREKNRLLGVNTSKKM